MAPESEINNPGYELTRFLIRTLDTNPDTNPDHGYGLPLNSAQAIFLRCIFKMIADRINSNFEQSPVEDKSRSGKTDEHNAPETTDIR